jgi:hypothetical protein
MFDRFMIESGGLSVVFENDACSVHAIENQRGTRFSMKIANNSNRTTQDVFSRFRDPNDLTFCKSKFFISLAAFEGELTSRSQAKRVVARFEDFKEVELDLRRQMISDRHLLMSLFGYGHWRMAARD